MLYQLSYMSQTLFFRTSNLERVAGIEPASLAWKAKVLPLNYTRSLILILNLVEGEGFEPSKLACQIYSLIPLATREPLQKCRHSLCLPTCCQAFPFKNLRLASIDSNFMTPLSAALHEAGAILCKLARRCNTFAWH